MSRETNKGTSPQDFNRLEITGVIMYLEHEVDTPKESRPEVVPYLTRRHELITEFNKSELVCIAANARHKSGMDHVSWTHISLRTRAWVTKVEMQLGASLSRLTARELSANTSVVKPYDETVRDLVAKLVSVLGLNTAHDYDGVECDSDVILYLDACIRRIIANKKQAALKV